MSEFRDIARYHELVSIKVRPQQLLLDPSNPRINVDVDSHYSYSPEELASDSVQNEILRKINVEEFKVSELLRGIQRTGFLQGTGPMIVEQVPGTDKYIVLEGNRRTTAIKQLLSNGSSLPKEVARSLELIEVKEFVYKDNDLFDKDEIIDILLGTIHISGPVAWGAMEKAHYIYKTYMRELSKSGTGESFYVKADVVRKLTEIFNSSAAEVRKSLRVYRVFLQLKQESYQVDSKKYSLIELATSNRYVRHPYFEMNEDYEFSSLGLERLDTLCLQSNAPITNPQLFNQFVYVVRHGNQNDIRSIENREAQIESVFGRVREDKEENKLLDELKDVLSKLRSLNVSGFANDEDENRTVRAIAEVVNHKLLAMIDEEPEDELEGEDWGAPQTVEELLSADTRSLQEVVKASLKDCANTTCVKRRLPDIALKHLGIVTRGARRQSAVERIESEVTKMVEMGLIKEYKGGTNLRLKLLAD
jgi:hypothetical protein